MGRSKRCAQPRSIRFHPRRNSEPRARTRFGVVASVYSTASSASSRSPKRAFAFILAFVQLSIPFLFRQQNLLPPRLPPVLLVSLRLSSKPWDLSRNLSDPSANPFASATCKPANSPALPKSLLSADTTPPLRTNTSAEPVAHSRPLQ